MGDHESESTMETNRQVQFNLGVFNVPTIAAVLGIYAFIYMQGADRAKTDTDFENRISSIETGRVSSRAEVNQRLDGLTNATNNISNLTYRVTALENANQAINARIDRQTDAIGDLRQGINQIGTKIEVLTQRLEIAFPLKRSELDILPSELRPDSKTR